MVMSDSTARSIRFPGDLYRAVRRAAAAEDRSVNSWIVRALRAAIEKLPEDDTK